MATPSKQKHSKLIEIVLAVMFIGAGLSSLMSMSMMSVYGFPIMSVVFIPFMLRFAYRLIKDGKDKSLQEVIFGWRDLKIIVSFSIIFFCLYIYWLAIPITLNAYLTGDIATQNAFVGVIVLISVALYLAVNGLREVLGI